MGKQGQAVLHLPAALLCSHTGPVEEGHAEKIIEEEAEADYGYLSNPKKRKIVVLDKDPKENKEYLDLKDPTSTEGSFKKGGLIRQGKPKLAKKGWR